MTYEDLQEISEKSIDFGAAGEAYQHGRTQMKLRYAREGLAKILERAEHYRRKPGTSLADITGMAKLALELSAGKES